jgi:hypothetical protein
MRASWDSHGRTLAAASIKAVVYDMKIYSGAAGATWAQDDYTQWAIPAPEKLFNASQSCLQNKLDEWCQQDARARIANYDHPKFGTLDCCYTDYATSPAGYAGTQQPGTSCQLATYARMNDAGVWGCYNALLGEGGGGGAIVGPNCVDRHGKPLLCAAPNETAGYCYEPVKQLSGLVQVGSTRIHGPF